MAKTPGIYHKPKSGRFPNGGWCVRYRDTSNMTRRKTFATKQDALTFQAGVRTDQSRGTYVDDRSGKTPFHAVAEAWYAALPADRKPKTLAGYRNILDHHLLPAFRHRPVSQINAAEIEKLLAGLRRSPGTQRNVLRVLSPIMKYAIRKNLIRANPCTMVDRLPEIRSTEIKPLTATQIALLAEEVGTEYRTMIFFAAYSGCRAGEIGALRVKDLDLMRRRATVRESLSDVNGTLYFGRPKNGKMRTVALPTFLVDMLMEHTAGKEQNDLVFPARSGKPRRHGNFMTRVFHPAVRRSLPEDLHDIRFHDLRHTCASLLIQAGMHPLAVSRHLGHSSIAITMDTYGHLFPEEQDRMSDALDGIYKPAQPTPDAEVHSLPQRR